MADNDTEQSSPVTKEDSINAIPETSSVDLEIQDIQGIGPTTAKKLIEAGIVSVMDLAVTSADELAVDINASKESAAAFPSESCSFHRTLTDSVDKGMDGILLGSPREQRQSLLGALSNPGYHNCSHQ
jgi:hypothetical protein